MVKDPAFGGIFYARFSKKKVFETPDKLGVDSIIEI